MKRKVVSLMMCAALTIAPASSVWAEDVLSSGEELEILQSETELIDGTGAELQEQPEEKTLGSEGELGNIKWTFVDGVLTFSGQGDIPAFIDSPFEGNPDIHQVILEEGITFVSGGLFEGCTSLEKVSFSSTLEVIGRKSFAGCPLTEITIPGSVGMVGEYAFENCANLKKVNFQGDNINLMNGAFQGCVRLSEIELPENMTILEEDLFKGCTALEEITIPKGMWIISEGAFVGTGLKFVVVPDVERPIADGAFDVTTVLHGYTDSEVERYAERNGNEFSPHDWEKTITKYPSCSAEGEYSCKCKLCGEETTEVIPSTGHTWENYYTTDRAATCTEDGLKSIHCKDCSARKDSTAIPAYGHNWDEGTVTKEPTCTEEGVKTYTCERCGETRTEALEKLEHDYEKIVEKASFGKEGSITEKCKACEEEKEKVVIPAVSSIQLSATEYSYNGTNRQPSVTVTDSQGSAVPASVSYPAESKRPGTYSVTVTLTGENYEGSSSASYVIKKGKQVLEFNDISKRIDSKTATLTAVITEGNKSGKIKYSSDNPHVATISANGKVMLHRVGTARITATVKENENYEGVSKTITLTVLSAPTAVTKLQSPKKGWLNIQYRANDEADGYQMQYGTSSDMKNAKYAAVNTPEIRSYTRKDVKSGETYYVRVRTFNMVNGKRVYSNWSGIKNVDVK